MLSHVDQTNQPTMVNVGDKTMTRREATATVDIIVPDQISELLVGEEILSKKGPVFATAIIAGTMAAKRTYELIPFCHNIPLDGCKITISHHERGRIQITCTVNTFHKTGVEMEALTGANIAALTIYDMCKAVSHDIVIRECRLISKTGGKSDVQR